MALVSFFKSGEPMTNPYREPGKLRVERSLDELVEDLERAVSDRSSVFNDLYKKIEKITAKFPKEGFTFGQLSWEEGRTTRNYYLVYKTKYVHGLSPVELTQVLELLPGFVEKFTEHIRSDVK